MTCPAPATADAEGMPRLDEADAEARLAMIQTTLRVEADRVHRWQLGAGFAGIGLSAGGFGLAALASNQENRADNLVGAVSSLLIPLRVVLFPYAVTSDVRELEDRVAARKVRGDRAETCALLIRAEILLARDAADEAKFVAWPQHALVIAYGLSLGAVLGFGFGHWKGAAVEGLVGIVVGELGLVTRPTGAVDALARYRQGDLAIRF